MSTIPQDKQTDYTNIQEGLKEGNRVVYDKKANRFQYMKTADAKSLVKNDSSHYTSDLTEVKQAIEDFIKHNEIDTKTSEEIQNAFKTRNDSLKKRIFAKLFSRSKLETASKGLEDCKNAVNTAAQKRLSQSASTATVGEKKPSKKETTPLVKSPTTNPSYGTSDSRGSSEPENILGAPSTYSAPLSGEIPPPPPPPPPPGGAPAIQEKYSGMHRRLMDNPTPLDGEPKAPTLKNEDHDFGKVNTTIKDVSVRQKYAQEIDTYLNGSIYTKNETKGLQTTTKELRQENGLKHAIAKGEKLIADHGKLEEQIAGIKQQNKELKAKLETAEETLKQVNKCVKTGATYHATYTTGKGTIPVPFFPQKTIDEMKQQLQGESAVLDYFQKNLKVNPDDCRSVEWKAEDLKSEIAGIQKELNTNSQQLAQFQAELKEVRKQGVRAMKKQPDTLSDTQLIEEFSNFQTLIENKKNKVISWTSVMTLLQGDIKAESPKKTKTPQAEENLFALENLLARFPVLGTLYKMRSAMSEPGQQAAYTRGKDKFYRDAK